MQKYSYSIVVIIAIRRCKFQGVNNFLAPQNLIATKLAINVYLLSSWHCPTVRPQLP